LGLVTQSVEFEGPAPPLLSIVDKIVEIGGLPLQVEESTPEIRADLYDQYARIGFACLTAHDIKIYTYLDGAVKNFLERSGMNKLPIAKVMVGANERPGSQTVYLEAYRGQDLTIMDVTVLALESLGGRPRVAPSPEVREKYAKPLTEAQLIVRKQSLRLRGLAHAIVAIMAVPFILIGVTCCLVFSRLNRLRSPAKRR
jgi:hypothetical protein